MSTPSAGPDPLVSVIIPCRNEAPHIRAVVDSLEKCAYPRERLEALFVDGMSTDGTRDILRDLAREKPFLRVLDNPARVAPAAMNVGLKEARGEVIVRLDAHSEYPADYIPRCVALLRSSPRAGNAGGRLVSLPNGDTPWARAVAYVTAHRFGVGGSAFRTGSRPGPVDTVAFGTFPRAALDEVGWFDARLTRNQDNELNARLRRAGYTILFDPGIRLHYRNQSTLRGLARQGYDTGMWNIYTLVLAPYTWEWRRYVPMAFVTYLGLLTAALAVLPGRWAAAAALPLALYALLVGLCSLGHGVPKGESSHVAATFGSYHVSYGAGALAGIAKVLTGRGRAELGRPLIN
jgi:glycosyltransferase involved in cell wall biosynthesis